MFMKKSEMLALKAELLCLENRSAQAVSGLRLMLIFLKL